MERPPFGRVRMARLSHCGPLLSPVGAGAFYAVHIHLGAGRRPSRRAFASSPASSQGGRRGRRHCDGAPFGHVRRRVPPRRPVGSVACVSARPIVAAGDGPSSDPGPCFAPGGAARGERRLRLRTAPLAEPSGADRPARMRALSRAYPARDPMPTTSAGLLQGAPARAPRAALPLAEAAS